MFASVGDVLWESVSDSQLCQFLMQATEDYMTSFGQQKNFAPHHLLQTLTPVSYTYGFIDFC